MEPKLNLVDHVIQRDIVHHLTLNGEAKFSDLKPKNLESNLFMYHMNQLKKRGVVKKEGQLYKLTTEGRLYVDRSNLEKLSYRIQPKIISILIIKSSTNKLAILKRAHEPHIGRLGFPSGKIHFGEKIETAAKRELDEKTGLKNVELDLRGCVSMRFLDKTSKKVVNHVVGNVFYGEVEGEPSFNVSSKYWETFWGSKKELFDDETRKNIFKGHEDILKLVSKNKMFIESLDFDSDY